VRELLDDVAAAKRSQDSGLAPQTLEALATQVWYQSFFLCVGGEEEGSTQQNSVV
jgi:hypothetical protein